MLRTEPQIKADYVAQGAVSLSFHHVLDHGDASRLAHHAAECAGSQAPLAFWQMHDLLFARQSQIWGANVDTMTQWAGELGLDTTAFAACMADDTLLQKVERLDQARRDAGIRQRPSFDLNGDIVAGALPYASFAPLIDAAR